MPGKKANNPVDKYVGSRVRMLRISRKMSQEGLGDALGLTFQQIQKYEKGTNRISASKLTQIATTLGVAPAYFFEGLPQEGARQPDGLADMAEFMTSSQGVRIAKAFSRIKSREVRLRFVELIEAVP